MKVKDLIDQLVMCSPESDVHCGYDGDIVCTRIAGVESIETESQIGPCWYHVKIGDVVILSEGL